jgi:uncharacterized RDD family membrane protein YckC
LTLPSPGLLNRIIKIDKIALILLECSVSKYTVTASVLPRVMAKAIDYLLAAAMMESIPRFGFYMGLLYILAGDSFFGGASAGKKLMGLCVSSRRGRETARTPLVRASILRNSTIALAFFLWKIPLIGWIFFTGITLLEFIIMIGNAERMRIGDELAATSVYETASIDAGGDAAIDAGGGAAIDAGGGVPIDAGGRTPIDAGGRTPIEEEEK